MVAHQPDRPTALHQLPDQAHGRFNAGAAIDHIAAEHEAIVAWQPCEQSLKGIGAAMDVPDDPVRHRVLLGLVGGRHQKDALNPVLPATG